MIDALSPSTLAAMRSTRRVISDAARRENVMGLMMSLNMLVEFGDAFDYSAADFRSWCEPIGFSRFEVVPLAGPSSAVVAYKGP